LRVSSSVCEGRAAARENPPSDSPDTPPPYSGDPIESSRLFDRIVDIDGKPNRYQAMNDREWITVLIRP
jgi:hypothetical protein